MLTRLIFAGPVTYFTIIKSTESLNMCTIKSCNSIWYENLSILIWICGFHYKFNNYIILEYRDVHYVANIIICNILCDILLQYHLNVKMFAILILQILIVQGGGDNTVHRKILEWEKIGKFWEAEGCLSILPANYFPLQSVSHSPIFYPSIIFLCVV